MPDDAKSSAVSLFLALRAMDPPCRYSILQKKYFHQDLRSKQWIGLEPAQHEEYLKTKLEIAHTLGASQNSPDPVISDTDWCAMTTRDNHSVEAAFDFDGLHQGDIFLGGKKYLNTGEPTLPMPVKGPLPVTKETISHLCFGKENDALVWQNLIRQYHHDFINMRMTPKFPILVVGDSREEGILFQDIFALFLGGKSYHYFETKVDNRQRLASIFWRVDHAPRGRSRLGFFDQLISRNEVSIKVGPEFQGIPFCAQKSIFLKRNSREVADLRMFAEEYNVHVLTLQPLNGFRPDFATLRNELPHFMHYLLEEFTLPDSLKGKYISPELDELLFEASATGQFWDWLKGELLKTNVGQSTQTWSSLRELFGMVQMGDPLREIVKKDGVNIPTLMEEICQYCPDEVKKVYKNKWKFNLQ